MSVTRTQVEYVAALARLRLTPDEAEQFTAQLNGILEHFEALSQIPLTAVAAVGGVAEGAAPLRPDAPGADALTIAPAELAVAWDNGFFTVPRLAALGGSNVAAEAP
jgi:aspartyl-tRNA(Asn)/glutamyl-tRNA(Gln) amidotransferase subunit C